MSNQKGPFKPSARRGLLFLLLLVSSFTYGVVYRHWIDWLINSYVAAMPIAFVFMFREGRMYREAAEAVGDKAVVMAKLALPVPILAIFIAPLGGFFYGIAAAVTDILQWIALQLSDIGRSAALAVVVTALLGSTFFAFRLKFRFIYGVTEAMVGLAVAAHRVGFTNTSESSGSAALYLAVLTAGIYLVVRGLDNMHQAWI